MRIVVGASGWPSTFRWRTRSDNRIEEPRYVEVDLCRKDPLAHIVYFGIVSSTRSLRWRIPKHNNTFSTKRWDLWQFASLPCFLVPTPLSHPVMYRLRLSHPALHRRHWLLWVIPLFNKSDRRLVFCSWDGDRNQSGPPPKLKRTRLPINRPKVLVLR